MQAPKQLRKPSNWQDFETLCKKLWCEIWECPEIKKNGRQGQTQHGVDVYGIPKGEEHYYGIQCKGKSDYVNSNLTDKEIIEEIAKAVNFKPPLKKFYFATTASKDASIEQQVRLLNMNQIKKGKFEVHLYSWEDIVDLMEENPNVLHWYINNQNYADKYDVEFCFSNGENTFTYEVPIEEITTEYIYKKPVEAMEDNLSLEQIFNENFGSKLIAKFSSISKVGLRKYNASIGEFKLMLKNTGKLPIKNCKVLMCVEGNYEASRVCIPRSALYSSAYVVNIFISKDYKSIEYSPRKETLIPGDTIYSDRIQISPLYLEKVNHISIKWKLLSETFQKDGVLELLLKPSYISKTKIIYVDKPEEERSEIKYEIHEEEGSII